MDYPIDLPISEHFYCSARPKKKKKPLILLEILIGLTLAGVLFSLLFTSITRVAKVEKKLEATRAALFTRQHLQMRLQDLFMGLSEGTFYTQRFPHEQQESLIVIFKNGIDPDPAFSGEVLGRIYLDENQNLCLATWSLEDEKLWRKEILFSHAENCQFQFLGKKRQEDTIKTVNASLAWHSCWPKERPDSPSIVRLEIGKKKTPLQFAFILPSVDNLVTYWEGGIAS